MITRALTCPAIVSAVTVLMLLAPVGLRAQQAVLTENFSRPDAGWETRTSVDGVSVIAAGVLLVRNETSSVNATVVYHQSTYANVIVEVDMMLVDGSENNWQTVYCRATDAGRYSVGVAADGYYNFEIWGRAGSGQRLSGSVEPTRHAAIRTGRGAVNRVRVECNGSRIRLSVNDTFVAEFNDTLYQNGRIALTVSSVEGDFSTVAFDNVRVSRP
jgi:hypothetical protein